MYSRFMSAPLARLPRECGAYQRRRRLPCGKPLPPPEGRGALTLCRRKRTRTRKKMRAWMMTVAMRSWADFTLTFGRADAGETVAGGGIIRNECDAPGLVARGRLRVA